MLGSVKRRPAGSLKVSKAPCRVSEVDAYLGGSRLRRVVSTLHRSYALANALAEGCKHNAPLRNAKNLRSC